MNFAEEKGYAKINLYLDVTQRRPDGYHTVNTLMQSVSLADDIRISSNVGKGIELTCSDTRLPTDKGNIAYRAAELFFERAGISSGVKIEIVKRIPVAAGLGGGSADAAAVLRGLNTLFDSPVDRQELLALGAKLGADVPFCIECGTVSADGRGDRLTSVASLFDCYIVIANGGEGISTPFAYGELDRIYNGFEDETHGAPDAELLIQAIENEDLGSLCDGLYNVFEKAILPIRPVAADIKRVLADFSARGVLMSGSGPTVFGIFDDEGAAKAASEVISQKGYFATVCTPVRKIY